MNTVYIGNTLVNDIFLNDKRVFNIGTPSAPLNIEYLVVAGGGAGGGVASLGPWAGGGGAGGLLSGSATLKQTNTTYTVVVGSGGPAGTIAGTQGRNGLQSYLTGSSLSIFTIGGGGGGGFYEAGVGANGGSGGGAAACSTDPCTVNGGTGTAGPPRQGHNGGNGFYNGQQCGGGAGSASGPLTANTGSGVYWVDGNYYAPGGKTGGVGQTQNEYGAGGPGQPGGGGSRNSLAGNSGVVIIRYYGTGSQATGGTLSYVNPYTYHTFTSGTGSFIY